MTTTESMECADLARVVIRGKACLALLLCALVAEPGHADDNWPGFRRNGDGLVSVSKFPLKWSPDDGIDWRTEIPGYGQSSPVIWKDTVFVTSSDGPFQQSCQVHAIDLAGGQIKWSRKIKATTLVENYFRNSRAAPTCAVDQHAVYAFFASGDLTALTHTGETLWSVPLFQKYGQVENERGVATSPVQTDDRLFVVIDHDGPSYIVAIDKETGAIAWKTDRGKRVPSWSTPVIAKQGQRKVVVVSSSDTVDAYDAKDGAMLWQIDGMQGNHIPSASVVDHSIFVGSTQMFSGDFDPETVAGSNCRIDLTTSDGKPDYQVMWGAQRANSYYSTPLAVAGYVYYVNKAGVMYCVNAETGEQVYAKRIGNPCWASAIGVQKSDGQLLCYFVMKNGVTMVLRPGDEFDQIARNRLWDAEQMRAESEAAAKLRKSNAVPPEDATPKTGPEKVLAGMPESTLHRMFSYGDPTVYAAAAVDGHLLIRTGRHLFCIQSE